ncbi:hypothetical protein ABK040_005194 [Willaertia magna]
MNLLNHKTDLIISLPILNNQPNNNVIQMNEIKTLTFNDQFLIIKDCLRSMLYTITFHRSLGEVLPIGMDCQILEQINYPSIDEKELNQILNQNIQQIILQFQLFLKEELKLNEQLWNELISNNSKNSKNRNSVLQLKNNILYKIFTIELKYFNLKQNNSSVGIFFSKKEIKDYFENWTITIKLQWNTNYNNYFNGLPIVKITDQNTNLQNNIDNNLNELEETLNKRLKKIIKSSHEDIPHLPNMTSENLTFANGKSYPFEMEVKEEGKGDQKSKGTGSGWFPFF